MPKENRLQNKVAIITGAASGIGAATVELFTEQGARVLANDLNGELLIRAHGNKPNVVCLAKDISDTDAPDAIIKMAIEAFSKIDILFNNAGICPLESYLEQSPKTWQQVMDINLTAVNRLTLAAAPHLKNSGHGRVINTASVQAKLAGNGLTAYTTSKHAIAGLTKQQALELGPYGITCNYLLPGFVLTGITNGQNQNISEEALAGFHNYWADKAPAGRLGQPIDIAYGALFLAQEKSGFINGSALTIDGGATAKL
jgi:NAD(P)-dependent dehydrogenase (short-subunit alcohol dehydrogenase family)